MRKVYGAVLLVLLFFASPTAVKPGAAAGLTAPPVAVKAAPHARVAPVSRPGRGEKWIKNQTYTILWKKSGQLNTRVNIGLYDKKGKVKKLAVANRVSDSGSYRWKIPASARPGSYMVMVESEKHQVVAKSSVFSILEKQKKIPGQTTAVGKVITNLKLSIVWDDCPM